MRPRALPNSRLFQPYSSVPRHRSEAPPHATQLRAKAFRGELVPQDPNDEPATVLLERIRAQRQTTSMMPSRKKQSKLRRLLIHTSLL